MSHAARPRPSRRQVLRAGAGVGAAGAVTTGAIAVAAPGAGSAVFRHGVASGDPTATRVVIWTRITPSDAATPGSGVGPAVKVAWQVATDDAFTAVVRSGTVTTTAGRDHTVKVDVDRLAPYTRYYYRFRALGQTSPVGQTQTAPDEAGKTHALRFAAASCACWTGGYFSAYKAIADRDDIDMVLFLGDYIYEYGNGTPGTDYRYGPASLAGKRDMVPNHEIFTLADYRQRYAQHRTDANLQEAHRLHPWIIIFDDHEVADNTWANGISGDENRTPAPVPFAQRKAFAYQAMLEWQPIRLPDQSQATEPHLGIRFWRSFSYGALADLHCLETRQNRSEQAKPVTSSNLFSVDAATVDDPNRHLPEPSEMAWLEEGVASGAASWHLLANQVVFAPLRLPSTGTDLNGLSGLLELAGIAQGGIVFNNDQWDGYTADQTSLRNAIAQTARGDVVFLTGDIHSSWAIDVPSDTLTYKPTPPLNNSVAVEFVTPSITSESIGDTLASTANLPASQAVTVGDTAAAGFETSNLHVRYLDATQHGFCVVDVTPARVHCDWWFVADRLDPQSTSAWSTSWETLKGSKRVSQGSGPVGDRSDVARIVVRAPGKGNDLLPPTPPSTAPTLTAPGEALAATGDSPRIAVIAAGLAALGALAARLRSRGRP